MEKTSGFADFVVWNPWAAGAAKMADMDDEEWKTFVCVEAAQTSKVVHVKASGDKDKVWKASHVFTLTDANISMGMFTIFANYLGPPLNDLKQECLVNFQIYKV